MPRSRFTCEPRAGAFLTWVVLFFSLVLMERVIYRACRQITYFSRIPRSVAVIVVPALCRGDGLPRYKLFSPTVRSQDLSVLPIGYAHFFDQLRSPEPPRSRAARTDTRCGTRRSSRAASVLLSLVRNHAVLEILSGISNYPSEPASADARSPRTLPVDSVPAPKDQDSPDFSTFLSGHYF